MLLPPVADITVGDLWQSPYSWADGVVQIKGNYTGSENPATLLGKVVAPAAIGTRSLQLDSVAGMQVGMWVRLLMSDVNGTLVKQLYGSAIDRRHCAKDCQSGLTNQQDMVKWMVRVAGIDGNTVTLQRALPVTVSPLWRAEVHRVPDGVPKNSGIRDLGVEFVWSPAAPHHHELGYNAFFIDGAVNAFLLNVMATNVDSAVLVRDSHQVSIRQLTVQSTKTRGSTLPFEGHIGAGVYDSSDVEVGYFDLNGEWIHDITVRGTLFTVFHNGRGTNMNMDTHRSAPYATLFSNLFLGKGARPFGTGGYLNRGFPTAKYTTYYNIRSARWQPSPMPSATMAGVSGTRSLRLLAVRQPQPSAVRLQVHAMDTAPPCPSPTPTLNFLCNHAELHLGLWAEFHRLLDGTCVPRVLCGDFCIRHITTNRPVRLSDR